MVDSSEGERKTGVAARGFASMDQSRVREIASKGGESVPAEKRSFSRNPTLAAEAGRKGGQSVAPERRSFSRNPALAAVAGRKGGKANSNAPRDEADPVVAADRKHHGPDRPPAPTGPRS